ncbi:MAG: hypothetical protein RLY70_405 [Planctomycetota bacterium]
MIPAPAPKSRLSFFFLHDGHLTSGSSLMLWNASNL